MCKEKATGEILAMKIRRKDVVVTEDDIAYTLTEKGVLHTLKMNTHPFLLVCQSSVILTSYPFSVCLCRVSSIHFRHLTNCVL